MVQYYQILAVCPECSTETQLLSLEANPVIFKCGGCNRVVVVNGDRAFNISSEFMDEMLAKYNFKFCGSVYYTDFVKSDSKDTITEDDIENLKDILDKNMDSKDLLDSI